MTTHDAVPKLDTTEAVAALRHALRDAARGLVEREQLVELVGLALVAGEHLLIIGPPGTAKSEAVRRVARGIDGRYFEYLLGRFTEPSEIFGPVDLERLKAGSVEVDVRGMLPEAEIAFLDEVFLGSTAILNTLLSLLNERTFRRGSTALDVPLRVAVGASNHLPEDPTLAAFADRFLLRVFIEPLPDPRIEELLVGGWAVDGTARVTEPVASMAQVDALARAVAAVDLTAVRPLLAQALRRLRREGIVLSDRRAVRCQRLLAAAAVLAGRDAADEADLWPLLYALPTAEQQHLGRDVLRDLLEPSHNDALPRATEEASLGPRARATRLVATARELLAARPADPDSTEAEPWRLRLEGVAREIDAGFAPDDLPEDLEAVRDELVSVLGVTP